MIEKNKYVLFPTLPKEKHLSADYIKLHCSDCGNTWGISLYGREFPYLTDRDLLCERCAAEAYQAEQEKY